ncbi:MAG: response regulator [Phormidesmis sp.]
MRILLVDDDENLMESLAELLIQQRYAVDIAVDGSSAETYVDLFDYDLIVLDLMLPDGDGIQFARLFREEGYANPLMILTAKESTAEKVKALDAGADDYVVKPFNFDELCARIRALLRREHQGLPPILSWGPLRLDPSACETTYKNSSVRLTPKEFSMMELFLRHPHRVYSLGAIIDDLWSFEDPPGEDAVRTHIKGLRRKLRQAGAPKDLIKTVYGLGYRLNENTAWSADSAAYTDVVQLEEVFSSERSLHEEQAVQEPLVQKQPVQEQLYKKQLDKEHLDKEHLDKEQQTQLGAAEMPRRHAPQPQAVDAHPSAGYSSGYLSGHSPGHFSNQITSQLATGAAAMTDQARLRRQLADAGRRYLCSAIAQITTLEKVTQALMQDLLEPALCQEGLVCAHQLSGSLGSFGFMAGSRTARQIEDALRSLLLQPQLNASMTLSTQLTDQLAQWVQTLRQSIEQAAASSTPDVLIIVTEDKQLSKQLAVSATEYCFQPQVVTTLGEATVLLQSTACDALLLDARTDLTADLSTFIQALHEDNTRSIAVPVAVIGTQLDWPTRLLLSQQGVSIVSDRTAPPTQIMRAVAQIARAKKRPIKVAIALTDPHLLARLNTQLPSQGFQVIPFESAIALWQWFDSVCEPPPVDILLLESGPSTLTKVTDSPLELSPLESTPLALSGLDLCRIIRSDPRSTAVPIVFLTDQLETKLAAETTANLYTQIYQAGGNDCIDKSVNLDELALRLRNQLPHQNLTGLDDLNQQI